MTEVSCPKNMNISVLGGVLMKMENINTKRERFEPTLIVIHSLGR